MNKPVLNKRVTLESKLLNEIIMYHHKTGYNVGFILGVCVGILIGLILHVGVL